jgi:endonuclease/exonuclease/phosphatase family metal-dependent hydrolase
MTYNLGGGRNIHASTYQDSITILARRIPKIINEVQPDLLFIQEAPEIITADGEKKSIVDVIAKECKFGRNFFYGVTLSMSNHLQVNKSIMRDGIYNDWGDWKHGNAIFSRSGFVRFSDTNKSGLPVNIPLFTPQVYQGNRDTDPRYAIFARINSPNFPYFIGVHLTTLLGERGELVIRGKSDAAIVMRLQQLQTVIDLIADNILSANQPIILLGDLNASIKEMTIAGLLMQAHHFHHLAPEVDIPTHLKLNQTVDHILIFPKDRFVVNRCYVLDNPETRSVSDHLPVVAEMDIK